MVVDERVNAGEMLQTQAADLHGNSVKHDSTGAMLKHARRTLQNNDMTFSNSVSASVLKNC